MSPRAGLDIGRVLEVAAQIADGHGLDEVTLAGLAKELQVRSPSLYNHFDGLPDLRRRLAIYGMKKLHDAMAAAADGRTQDEAVYAVAKAYVDFARRHPGLYDALVRAADWADPETQQAAARPVQLMVRIVAAYGLEGDDAVHAVRGLRSVFHGFASLEKSGNYNMPVDPEDSLRFLIDIFLWGLRAMAEMK